MRKRDSYSKALLAEEEAWMRSPEPRPHHPTPNPFRRSALLAGYGKLPAIEKRSAQEHRIRLGDSKVSDIVGQTVTRRASTAGLPLPKGKPGRKESKAQFAYEAELRKANLARVRYLW